MVRQLTVGNEAVCRTARKVLKTADEAGDDPSVDLLTQRLQTHVKYACMLRSPLRERGGFHRQDARPPQGAPGFSLQLPPHPPSLACRGPRPTTPPPPLQRPPPPPPPP